MSTLRALSLLAATITMGLAAGAFAIFAHTIMPGLKKSDDHTFVAAFQSIDRAIINPWFMAGIYPALVNSSEARPNHGVMPSLSYCSVAAISSCCARSRSPGASRASSIRA